MKILVDPTPRWCDGKNYLCISIFRDAQQVPVHFPQLHEWKQLEGKFIVNDVEL